MTTMADNALLEELARIEGAIAAANNVLEVLTGKYRQLISTLDVITKPDALQASSTRQGFASRPRIYRGYEFNGTYMPCFSYVEIYQEVLKLLWSNCPEKRDSMASAMKTAGYSRCYVARHPSDLFAGATLAWANQHSVEFSEGWYLDKQVNLERMRRVLPLAIEAAGLTLGTDVKIYWNNQAI